ncbi:MAG TPA: protein kinase [Polyangiaceae bacterium]
MSDEPVSDTSHLDPASRRVGTVLDGKWTLDRLLGVGGMAAVYAATHRNGARAAIKLFPFSVTTSAEFAERILREGYLANKIGHSAIVRVLDDHLDREREYAYLVMELLEGQTARERVERGGPMSPIEAVEFAIELMDCLAAAHTAGVIHRDIKPENLFLTDDHHLKVLDFGVARAMNSTSSSVTRTGAMLGTPAYMSPEQARGRPSELSARSDIYSAGATLLFLVAGEFVHEGESAQEVMVRAAWTPPKKMEERGLGLPLSIAAVIDRACEFEAKERYQTAAEMLADLEAARTVLAGDPKSTEPIARTSKRPPRGPIVTAPLPLSRPTPSSQSEQTIADRTPQPPTPASDHRTPSMPSRRTTLGLGALTVVLLAVLFVVLRAGGSRNEPVHSSTPSLQSPHETSTAKHTPPEPEVVRVAPVAVDTSPSPPGPKTQPLPESPRVRPVASHAALLPHPSSAPRVVAPVAPPSTRSSLVPAAPPIRASAAAAPITKPVGRDVGY